MPLSIEVLLRQKVINHPSNLNGTVVEEQFKRFFTRLSLQLILHKALSNQVGVDCNASIVNGFLPVAHDL